MLNGALETRGPADLVIVGGGGLLKSSFDRFWSYVLDAHRRRNFQLIVWGIGVCDVKGQDTRGSRQLHDEIAERCSLMAVRDERSRECFSDTVPVAITGCPAIPFSQAAFPGGGRARSAWLVVDRPGLLEAMGEQEVRGGLAGVVGRASAPDRPLVSIDNLVRMPPRPLPRDLAARLVPGRTERAWISRRHSSYVRRYYLAADAIITSRLHGAMIASALGVPWIALSGDHKIEGFADLVGASDLVCGSVDALRERLGDTSWRERVVDVATITERSGDFSFRARELLRDGVDG